MDPIQDQTDRKLSVLYINPTKQIRAGIDSLSKGLVAKGHDVRILLPSEGQERVNQREGVTYDFYNAKYIPKIRYTLPTQSFYTKLCSHATSADIVHAYSYFYLPCTLSMIAGSQFGAKTLVTVDSLPGINWTYGDELVDFFGKLYTTTLGRLTFLAADRVVGLGEYLREDLQRYVVSDKIYIIPNGIEMKEYNRRPSRSVIESDDEVKLLFVGRLDPVKGVPYLLKAVSQLCEKTKQDYVLTIVGDGTERDKYKHQCEMMGLSDRVKFEGWQKDVDKYYRNNNILILPSISEGQPTVLLEAQANGVPVVTTDVGGASDLIGAGKAVPSRNSEALANAILEVIKKSIDERDISKQARKYIIENYTMEQMCNKYLSLYSNLLNST